MESALHARTVIATRLVLSGGRRPRPPVIGGTDTAGGVVCRGTGISARLPPGRATGDQDRDGDNPRRDTDSNDDLPNRAHTGSNSDGAAVHSTPPPSGRTHACPNHRD